MIRATKQCFKEVFQEDFFEELLCCSYHDHHLPASDTLGSQPALFCQLKAGCASSKLQHLEQPETQGSQAKGEDTMTQKRMSQHCIEAKLFKLTPVSHQARLEMIEARFQLQSTTVAGDYNTDGHNPSVLLLSVASLSKS